MDMEGYTLPLYDMEGYTHPLYVQRFAQMSTMLLYYNY